MERSTLLSGMAELGETPSPPVTTRRRFLAFLGLGGAAASIQPQVVLGAAEAAVGAVEKAFETQAQKDARKALLEAKKTGQKLVKKLIVGPEGVNLRAAPIAPEDPKNEPEQAHLKPGTIVENLIPWEGTGSQGRGTRGEYWYALFNPGDKREPQKAQVLFGMKEKFADPYAPKMAETITEPAPSATPKPLKGSKP